MKSISKKVTAWIVTTLFISYIITNIVMFFTIFQNTLDAAGIEAYGCAFITTGMIDPSIMEKSLAGDKDARSQLGKTLNWTVDHKDIFRNQYILDVSGHVIAADDYSHQYEIEENFQHPISEETIEFLITEKKPTYSEIYDLNGHSTLTGFAPIFKDGKQGGEVVAISAIDFDGTIIFERTFSNLLPNIFWNFIQIALVIIVSSYFINRTLLPVKIVRKKMNEVSNGDLTTSLAIQTNDEIGTLATDFASLIDRFRHIIRDVSENTMHITNTYQKLLSSVQDVSGISAINSEKLQEINTNMNVQFNHAMEINDLLQNTSENIQKVTNQLYKFGEILTYTVDVSQSSIEVMNYTNDQIEKIGTQTNRVKNLIVSLEGKSNQIDHMIKQINHISEKTNILSLNASIEAARAGESGQGFQVVANEIRKLAEESGKSTKEIQQLLNEIQTHIKESYTESEIVDEETRIGIQQVKEARELFLNLNESIETARNEFHSSTRSVNSAANDVEKIVKNMGEIVTIFRSSSAELNQIAESIRIQDNSLTEVVEEASHLEEGFQQLSKKITYFKIH
mgnify:CR=1 FL=1